MSLAIAALAGMFLLLVAIYGGSGNEGMAYVGAALALCLVPIGSLLAIVGAILVAVAVRRSGEGPSRVELVLGISSLALVLIWIGTIAGVVPAPW